MPNFRCSHCQTWKIADWDLPHWRAYDPEGNLIPDGLIRGEATYGICPMCVEELAGLYVLREISSRFSLPDGFLKSPIVRQDEYDFMEPQECCLCGEKVTSWSRLDGNTTGKNYFFCNDCSRDFSEKKKQKLVERMERVEWKRRRHQ